MASPKPPVDLPPAKWWAPLVGLVFALIVLGGVGAAAAVSMSDDKHEEHGDDHGDDHSEDGDHSDDEDHGDDHSDEG